MKVVLLAGGLGTRLREETEYKPKPMVEIGGKPIIYHIMKTFLHFGFNEFVIATGYKSNIIKEYFSNYEFINYDFSLQISKNQNRKVLLQNPSYPELKVDIIDTGLNTMTGGRIYRLKELLGNDDFLCTYGDGLSNVNIKNLVNFHNKHKKIATITAVKPLSRFGLLDIDDDGEVLDFSEKPRMSQWVNGGFFVFKKEIFNYLNEDSILEHSPLASLASDSQLMAFKHDGFWQPMDTYREYEELNRLWNSSVPPWVHQ